MIEHRTIKRFNVVALIGVLAVLLPATASASVIFTNFGASLAYDTSQGNPIGNDFAGDDAAQGNSFVLSSEAIFRSAMVALSCDVGCPEVMNFTWTRPRTTATHPGAVIESFLFTDATLTALGNNNTPIAMTSVLHPTLLSGMPYWITVSSSVTNAFVWNNNSTGDTNDQAVSSDGGTTWFAPTGATSGALEVDGTVVPEPSPGFLAGAGLIVAWWRKRLASARPNWAMRLA
jgi:hypothetical protein